MSDEEGGGPKQGRHDIDEIEAVDVAGWVDASQKGRVGIPWAAPIMEERKPDVCKITVCRDIAVKIGLRSLRLCSNLLILVRGNTRYIFEMSLTTRSREDVCPVEFLQREG